MQVLAQGKSGCDVLLVFKDLPLKIVSTTLDADDYSRDDSISNRPSYIRSDGQLGVEHTEDRDCTTFSADEKREDFCIT